MNLIDFFKDGLDRFQRNFMLNKVSKHAGAKQPKKNAQKAKKIRRKMAKTSRRINRRK